MTTSSNGNIFRVTGHLCGEFTGEFPTQRPVMRSFDVFFDLRLNKRLSKQSWGWWFGTPSRPLWRHCNVGQYFRLATYHPVNTQLNLYIYINTVFTGPGISIYMNIEIPDMTRPISLCPNSKMMSNEHLLGAFDQHILNTLLHIIYT